MKYLLVYLYVFFILWCEYYPHTKVTVVPIQECTLWKPEPGFEYHSGVYRGDDGELHGINATCIKTKLKYVKR